jgi:hypothetical protein
MSTLTSPPDRLGTSCRPIERTISGQASHDRIMAICRRLELMLGSKVPSSCARKHTDDPRVVRGQREVGYPIPVRVGANPFLLKSK